MSATTALWLAVAASGLYHGLNPGMGWPLAVAAGLMERSQRALLRTLALLAAGHLASIGVVLLPFAGLALLNDWSREIRIGSGLAIIGFAAFLLVFPRHPRFLARVRPTEVALWSFLIGLVHGAGLILVPILLGLCGTTASGEAAGIGTSGVSANGVMTNGILAIGIAVLHMTTMIGAGGVLAFAVYRILGIKFLTSSWFDLNRVWAASLVFAGALGIYTAL